MISLAMISGPLLFHPHATLLVRFVNSAAEQSIQHRDQPDFLRQNDRASESSPSADFRIADGVWTPCARPARRAKFLEPSPQKAALRRHLWPVEALRPAPGLSCHVLEHFTHRAAAVRRRAVKAELVLGEFYEVPDTVGWKFPRSLTYALTWSRNQRISV